MKRSAGILVYRFSKEKKLEFFLVHPGGPFFAKKDNGVWTIPKGEIEDGEDALAAAKREFSEETGFLLEGTFTSIGQIRQKAGKIVEAWGVEADFDPANLRSNQFELEWPPRSGKKKMFPEIDRAGWFTIEEALIKINPAQIELLSRIIAMHQTI